MENTIEEKIKWIKSNFKDEVVIKISAYTDTDDGKIHYVANAVIDVNFEDVSLYWQCTSTTKRFNNVGASQICSSGKTIEEALNNMLVECAVYSNFDYVAQPYGIDEDYNK